MLHVTVPNAGLFSVSCHMILTWCHMILTWCHMMLTWFPPPASRAAVSQDQSLKTDDFTKLQTKEYIIIKYPENKRFWQLPRELRFRLDEKGLVRFHFHVCLSVILQFELVQLQLIVWRGILTLKTRKLTLRRIHYFIQSAFIFCTLFYTLFYYNHREGGHRSYIITII